jgi:hypothetical protein
MFEVSQMKSLGFIPLGVVLLAGGLAAQPHHFVPDIIDIIKKDGEVGYSPEVIHRVGNSGMLIAVHDGTVSVETPGSAAAKISMKAGDFDWRTGPLAHTITNAGPARFEAVEAVWK